MPLSSIVCWTVSICRKAPRASARANDRIAAAIDRAQRYRARRRISVWDLTMVSCAARNSVTLPPAVLYANTEDNGPVR
jgi:hypothetical protein